VRRNSAREQCERTVRHTPALWATPLREGMDYRIELIIKRKDRVYRNVKPLQEKQCRIIVAIFEKKQVTEMTSKLLHHFNHHNVSQCIFM
jgi:hypothetical protein